MLPVHSIGKIMLNEPARRPTSESRDSSKPTPARGLGSLSGGTTITERPTPESALHASQLANGGSAGAVRPPPAPDLAGTRDSRPGHESRTRRRHRVTPSESRVITPFGPTGAALRSKFALVFFGLTRDENGLHDIRVPAGLGCEQGRSTASVSFGWSEQRGCHVGRMLPGQQSGTFDFSSVKQKH
jgi:hypothetical protein